jgi:hypothetical protein
MVQSEKLFKYSPQRGDAFEINLYLTETVTEPFQVFFQPEGFS